jgi:hypothetical protein
MKAGEILELILRFRGMPDEDGNAMTSQAADLLRSGWDAVGYLMVAPTLFTHADGKKTLHGTKRIAVDSESAAEMEAWFHRYAVQGYTPLCRFYLKEGKAAMRNPEFKNAVVYRAKAQGYEVIVEFIPAAPDLKREDFAALAEHLALDWFEVKGMASELAMQAGLAKRLGAKFTYFNSSSTEEESPERNSAIGLRGHFGTGGYDAD